MRAQLQGRAGDDGTAGIDRRRQRLDRVERLPEQRVELRPRGDHDAFDRGGLILRRGKGEVGLKHLEARRITCLEPRLRRIASPSGEVTQFPQHRRSGIGDEHLVVSAPDIVADLRDRGRQFSIAAPDRRLAHGDAFRALAAEFERQGDAERLFRRLFFDLDRRVGIGPLARDGNASEIDRMSETCRRDDGIGRKRPLHCGAQGERLSGRGLRRGRYGREHGDEADGSEVTANAG